MGIRLLVTGARTAKAKGTKVVLVVPPGPIRDVLESSSVDQIVPVVADATLALARLRDASRA
jgi:anti-anti-sigma regulatory factor